MASRRQCLSQRRKAVGLTQESLAERLGVERSTVVRWEAGDTEPLPSIRPNLASALQVSIDQLAELLNKTEDAGTTQAAAVDTDATVSTWLPEVGSQLQLGRAQFDALIRPQAIETVEALRRALRSADVSPQYFDALLLVCGISRAPLVTQLLSTEFGGPVAVHAHPQTAIARDVTLPGLPAQIIHPAEHDNTNVDVRLDTLVPTTVDPARLGRSNVYDPAHSEAPHRPPLTTPWHRVTLRRFTRFAAAGVLVLVGVATAVPLVNFHRASIPPMAAGTATPTPSVVAIPAPHPGSHNTNSPHREGPSAATYPAPAAPNTAIDGAAPPAAAVAPEVRNPTGASNHDRPTTRSKAPAAKAPSPRRPPAIPAEAYAAWSRMAELSGNGQYRARFRPAPPS
jgi:DNA-binding XRE family transcriptional regulator